MQTEGNHPEQFVAGTSDQESQMNGLSEILCVFVESSFFHAYGIDERAKVEFSLCIHPMQSLRRSIRPFAVLYGRVIRREETSAGNHRVQRGQSGQPEYEFVFTLQAGPLSARILGSAQYSSRSASRFPPTRKTVERRTPPITR